MSTLRGQLVDRARYKRTVIAAAKIEGQAAAAVVTGEWIAARLVIREADERTDPAGGTLTIPARADLITAADGATFRSTDQLEVDSPMLGPSVWRITGAPQLGGQRTIRAVVIPLERTETAAADSVLHG